MKRKQPNNKGFSLVEFLVALAISVIVIAAALALMQTGVNSSRKQVNQSQLQEEANITMNNISDSVMEADKIMISTSNAGNKNTILFRVDACDNKPDKFKQIVYNESKQELYVNTQDTEGDPNDSAVQNNLLCSNITSFKVQIMQNSLETSGEGASALINKINEPIQVKISMVLEKNGFKRDISRVVSVRNSLDEISLKAYDDSSYVTIKKDVKAGEEANYLNSIDVIAK